MDVTWNHRSGLHGPTSEFDKVKIESGSTHVVKALLSRSSKRMASSSSSNRNHGPIRVGMFGGGTVGGGVYELVMGRLQHQRQQEQQRILGQRGFQMCRPMVITKICVKNLSKPRSFHLDEEMTTLTTNVDSILEDDSIEMIVEVMDGHEVEIAKYVTERALAKHKSVVTANTAMLAQYLDEISTQLSTLQQQPQKYNHDKHTHIPSTVGMGYEAAVCGGIPIIHTLQSSCYVGDVIHQIQGICNGATNYMLCKMEQSGMDLEDAFSEARELGYLTDGTESLFNDNDDGYPSSSSADVDGLDSRDKICLLAKLAFGVTVPPQSVPCRGILRLTSVDFEYAKLLKCTIKLLGTARRLHHAREWDGPLCVYVSPVMLPKTHVLANVKSNGNAIAITSANMGTCSYMGPGSGRFPTANSIVADMSRMAQAKTIGKTPPPPFPCVSQLQEDGISSPVQLDYDFVGAFYIRIPYADGLGIIKRVGELCEEYEISIHSILQNPIRDRMSADFCITTEDDCKQSQVEALCEAVSQEYFCRAPCLWMPLLFG